MNAALSNTKSQTMSSLEISKLTQKSTTSLNEYLDRKDREKLNKTLAENAALTTAIAKINSHVTSCYIAGLMAKISRRGDDCFFESGKLRVSIVSGSIEESLLIIDKALAKKNGITLEGKGFIYLVSDGENTKIGATTYNPVKRLNELQVGNAKKLTLIGSYAAERRIATESLLHETYRRKSIRGEWFKLSGQDIVDIINNRTQSSNNSTYQALSSSDAQSIIDSLCAVYSDDYEFKIRLRTSRITGKGQVYFENRYRKEVL